MAFLGGKKKEAAPPAIPEPVAPKPPVLEREEITLSLGETISTAMSGGELAHTVVFFVSDLSTDELARVLRLAKSGELRVSVEERA